MKIATWNVNSIRVRAERLAAWLGRVRPDVLCLQELKCVDADFPHALVEQAGYRAAVHGQKTYNGVAILSLVEPRDVRRGMEGEPEGAEARLLSAQVGSLRVVSAYVPNGQEVGSEKWAFKLDWMRRLGKYLERTSRPDEPLVVCGDLNVARDDLDVARPKDWAESVLCHSDARAAFERWCAWGLADVFRRHHPEGGLYSWWDYRMLAFPKNHGLRLDYVLATELLAARCVSAEIDRQERKGAKPSDHAPVVAEFALDGC